MSERESLKMHTVKMRRGCCPKEGLKRGAWTSQEDNLLSDYIKAHGLGRWRSLPANAGCTLPEDDRFQLNLVYLELNLGFLSFPFLFFRFESVWQKLQAAMAELS